MACRSSLTARSGQMGSDLEAVIFAAGPGFFDTLRIPLLYGRVFDARDRADTPRVAVITDRMARQYFGAVNAVGRRFRLAERSELLDGGDRRRARYGHGRLWTTTSSIRSGRRSTPRTPSPARADDGHRADVG